MESDSAVFASRIFWNRDRAAEVFLVVESEVVVEFSGERRSFRWSSNLRKSEMLSSSACKEPELVSGAPASIPEAS